MAAKLPTLRIIEPNLRGPSGHYAEFVRAVSNRSAGVIANIDIAASAQALEQCDLGPHTTVRGTFHGHKWREEVSELRSALRSSDPFLILTARPATALALEVLARGANATDPKALQRARLYFHWCSRGMSERLMSRMAHHVRAQAMAIAPTPTIAEFLRNAGWKRVEQVPYPILPPATIPAAQPNCRMLLMAGAARMNKGLALVAGVAELYGQSGRTTPLLVQTTPKRASEGHGRNVRQVLAQLSASGAPGLIMDPVAPQSIAYGERFNGALVLAPYEPAAFADGVTGVVLDGLLRGAPCVTSADSWPGRLVERFGCGVTFTERTPRGLAAAIDAALADWDGISAGAQQAARALAAEHDPAHLARVLARAD